VTFIIRIDPNVKLAIETSNEFFFSIVEKKKKERFYIQKRLFMQKREG